MKNNFPNVKLVEVFDLVSSNYVIYPYLGSILIECDENDEVFSKLKIWTTGENGEKTLLAIAEAGVGAIYLGSAATKFNMVNSDGSSNGELQRSGIFLKESGEAGLIQHIDLTK